MDIVKSEISMANEVELCVEVGSNIGDTLLENADINQLCRTCANTHDNMIPIFEGDGLEHDLQNKIDKHFPVNITKDDGLPNKMCFQCASTLVAWHDMFTGCIEAEKKLKHLLDKLKDDGQVGESVFGSSVVNEDSTSVNLKAQQKTGSEMEIDNDDGNDDDYAPEHGGDDDDDEDDDDEEEEEEDEEDDDLETEVVLHKLDAKEKEKTVEVSEKGTTIRDQIMVVRKDINRMQLISYVLHMNGNEKTLELSTDFPESLGGNLRIVDEVLKHVRRNNGLTDDDTVAVKVNSTPKKKENEPERKRVFINKMDMKATKLNTAAPKNGYYCKKCNLRYRHKHNFDAHIKTHDSGNSEEAIKNRQAKYLERLAREAKEKLYCEKCNKYLMSRSGLSYHIKHFHLGVKKHACDICGRCFAMKGAMQEHRRIHTGERPFICQVCGKAQRTSAILYVHLKSHSNERPFSCPTCHKTFKYSHQLGRHNVVHTGERNYVCELCGKRFASSRDMKRHNLTHNGLKPYMCPMCDSTFNQKRYLKQHLNGKHRLDAKAACTIAANIVPHETEQITTVHYKHRQNACDVQQNIPVHETEASLNVLQNVEVTMNETEEALRVLASEEINQPVP